MAFPYAELDTFQFVRERIDQDPRLDLKFINAMLASLRDLMEEAGISGKVQIIVNGYWQAWQKLRRMARDRRTSLDDFSAVNDIISFRLIVEDDRVEDCYRLLSKVNLFFNRNLDHNRFDDYIASPQHGYRALQVTAWLPDLGAVEVAIATEAMEGENLWGVIYALQHDKDISQYKPIQIFTPSGGTRFLPDGSTVVDAVASIQDFLLDKISHVEVNSEAKVLSDLVLPGDVVEVITEGERIEPSPVWLQFCNLSTARQLRSVLVMASLKQAAERGRRMLTPLLNPRGIADLEDVMIQERGKFENFLSELAAASLDDLYAALGGGAIRLEEVDEAMDEVGISREALGWTTISIVGPQNTNKPGVLADLASVVSQFSGNILRTVNNTSPDGSFTLRWVIQDLAEDRKPELKAAFENCGIYLTQINIC